VPHGNTNHVNEVSAHHQTPHRARPSKALASQTSSGQPVWGQAATSRVLASGLRNACEDGFSEVSWRTWGWGDGAWGSCRRLYCKFTSKRGSRPEHLQVPSGGQGYDTAHRRKPQISGRSERQRRIWSMRPGTNGSPRSDDVRMWARGENSQGRNDHPGPVTKTCRIDLSRK